MLTMQKYKNRLFLHFPQSIYPWLSLTLNQNGFFTWIFFMITCILQMLNVKFEIEDRIIGKKMKMRRKMICVLLQR